VTHIRRASAKDIFSHFCKAPQAQTTCYPGAQRAGGSLKMAAHLGLLSVAKTVVILSEVEGSVQSWLFPNHFPPLQPSVRNSAGGLAWPEDGEEKENAAHAERHEAILDLLARPLGAGVPMVGTVIPPEDDGVNKENRRDEALENGKRVTEELILTGLQGHESIIFFPGGPPPPSRNR
jgi:hypothetical protein